MKSIKQIGLLSFLLLFAFACKKDKTSAVTGEATAVGKMSGDTYNVSAGSTLNWKGSKLAGDHTGTLAVSEGKISMENGKVTGGKFSINMNSLACTDLAAGEGKEDLEGHLKSPDFFDVAAHPEATFDITKVTGLANDPSANSLVYGNLTIKGVSKEVAFKAKINSSGNQLNVSSPEFAINRTDFGIKYGSTSFMDVVKDKAINDEVNLSINLNASK